MVLKAKYNLILQNYAEDLYYKRIEKSRKDKTMSRVKEETRLADIGQIHCSTVGQRAGDLKV